MELVAGCEDLRAETGADVFMVGGDGRKLAGRRELSSGNHIIFVEGRRLEVRSLVGILQL